MIATKKVLCVEQSLRLRSLSLENLDNTTSRSRHLWNLTLRQSIQRFLLEACYFLAMSLREPDNTVFFFLSQKSTIHCSCIFKLLLIFDHSSMQTLMLSFGYLWWKSSNQNSDVTNGTHLSLSSLWRKRRDVALACHALLPSRELRDDLSECLHWRLFPIFMFPRLRESPITSKGRSAKGKLCDFRGRFIFLGSISLD